MIDKQTLAWAIEHMRTVNARLEQIAEHRYLKAKHDSAFQRFMAKVYGLRQR